jgi:hypothetical protein
MQNLNSHVISVLVLMLILPGTSVGSEGLHLQGSVKFRGDTKANKDVSAIGRVGAFIVIGADEAVGPDENLNIIQVLSKQGDDQYVVSHDIVVMDAKDEEDKELDIEGIAVDGNSIYVVGSHSSKRNRVRKKKNSYEQNRETFFVNNIADEVNRNWLYRLTVDEQVQTTERNMRISLNDIILNHNVLKTFSQLPSKENGIDIEGISVVDEWVYVGFRGPVFRGNYVPVLKFKFDDHVTTASLLFVNLGGGGIRDMASFNGGILIISGPVGDGPGSYRVHYWNGQDMIPGKDREKTKDYVSELGEIDAPRKGKAEGILVLDPDDDCSSRFMIVYDGVKNGGPQIYCSM